MSTINAAWKWYLGELSRSFPEYEAKAIAREIFEHFFNMEPAYRALNPTAHFSQENLLLLQNTLEKLCNNIPLQYVTGIAQFCDLTIRVDHRVLIPRPETEELVLWVHDVLQKEYSSQLAKIRILDVCTGSGCIAVTMAAKWPNAEVYGCDNSLEALEVAKSNALENEVGVDFFPCNVLTENIGLAGLDVVVANPPYVKLSDKSILRPNVVENEPHAAIFVPDNDPLVFYRQIAMKAFVCLKPGGWLFFEINELFPAETSHCIMEAGFKDIVVRNDVNGKPRMVMAWKPNPD
ncbi:MAG TPA: peptide chain release factor N(5)-glutamine methyltransferase [Bacteroidales bacterium]|nr:peptide chain release factor N(5)-glutamine methyltransferase [Bacteroidales bacterium]